ncbi:hypothetical protein WJX77_001044 [Trebouxia sp. C0004]
MLGLLMTPVLLQLLERPWLPASFPAAAKSCCFQVVRNRRCCRELGSAAIKSKSDVAKMKAADVKMLVEYLQQHLENDPQNGSDMVAH